MIYVLSFLMIADTISSGAPVIGTVMAFWGTSNDSNWERSSPGGIKCPFLFFSLSDTSSKDPFRYTNWRLFTMSF